MSSGRRDRSILEAVHAAVVAADRAGISWVDSLPPYISEEARYQAEPFYVGTLPDGRTIWMKGDHSKGADQYTIHAPEGVGHE